MNNKEHYDLCNDDTYKAVFMQHGQAIRNFLYVKCSDMELAEDITQDVFVTLWQKCTHVDYNTVKSFLFKIANNRLIDHFRHQKVATAYKTGKPSKIDNITPHFVMEEQEFKETLDRVIAKIPEQNRIVFLMSRIEKMKYTEIAQHLGISVKAIEKRMHKALIIIKNELGKKL